MALELVYLKISPNYQYKDLYLQHIYDMTNIELVKGDTYSILFDKLVEHYKDNVEQLKAVNDWISLNKEIINTDELLNKVICKGDTLYAAFDIIPIKTN